MKFGLIANVKKKLFWEKLPDILSWFADQKIPLFIDETIAQAEKSAALPEIFPVIPRPEICQNCDMILAIGGDGTILRTIQLIGEKETPVLGINVGGLGFLTEIPLEKFAGELREIARGHFRTEKRLILKGQIVAVNKPLFALNEIVIDKGNSIRVIKIEVAVDGHLLNSFIADGLLISTPTGSTGYSLSSGGPIIVPSTNVLVINPICPHSLTNRPVIVPADAKIETITRTEAPNFVAAADGQDMQHLPTRTKIDIEKADFCANLVKPLGSSFFQLLHSKLNWGQDFRDKNRWSHNS